MSSLRSSWILALILATGGCLGQDYQGQSLTLHNQYRATHHVPALQLDSGLNQNAIACAQYYAQIGTIDHSCPYKNGAGENLYWSGGSGGPPSEVDAARGATTVWYNEVQNYDFNNPGFSGSTGHFTQVVWKSSTRLGVGVYRDQGSKRAYVCALYSPPGNYLGQFPENVLRP